MRMSNQKSATKLSHSGYFYEIFTDLWQ